MWQFSLQLCVKLYFILLGHISPVYSSVQQPRNLLSEVCVMVVLFSFCFILQQLFSCVLFHVYFLSLSLLTPVLLCHTCVLLYRLLIPASQCPTHQSVFSSLPLTPVLLHAPPPPLWIFPVLFFCLYNRCFVQTVSAYGLCIWVHPLHHPQNLTVCLCVTK